MAERICEICEKSYIVKSHTQRSCSKECGIIVKRNRMKIYQEGRKTHQAELVRNHYLKNRKLKRIESNCLFCENTFITNGRLRYCSNECKVSARTKRWHSNKKLKYKTLNCSICGNAFITTHGLKKTCSDECAKKNELLTQRITNNTRYSNDPLFRVAKSLNFSLRKIAKKNGTPTAEVLKFTINDYHKILKNDVLYNEWVNDHSSYHIDHIIPLASYSVDSIIDPEIQKACSPRNLRIMYGIDNMSKGGRLDMNLVKQYGIEDLLPEGIYV